MIKLKGLRPSLREKKRYLVYQVHTDKSLNMKSFQDKLIVKIQELLGIYMPAGLLPIKFDDTSKKGIIRVNHTALDYVRGSFVLINSVDNIPVSISTVGVSGILKKAKEYM